MAILKHIASKNADYGEAERYLIFRKYVIIRICQQLYFSDTLFS